MNMKVTLNTLKPVSFYGINSKIERIKSQLQNKTSPFGQDSFTKTQSAEQTVIIENYYEGGQNKDNTSGLYSQPRNSNAAAEGAVSGATTGGAIEGTKAIAQKVKDAKAGAKETVDADSNTPVDLSDDPEENTTTGTGLEKEHIENENTDTDIDTETEVEPEVEPELEPEIEPEVDPELDTDIDTDVDADIDVDVEFDPDLEI